ncbi:MAG: hypothetical protein LBU12_01505 [Deltaproteobacteria bacterium]|jgi:hypothetical protein|nr:hypothetical protein [Deltaproteobacteria bacterium]
MPGRERKDQGVFEGRFFGAGKTALLEEIKAEFEDKGLRAGLIANDLAPCLVDSFWLSDLAEARELAGGRFGGDFPAFEKALDSLRTWGVQVIVAAACGADLGAPSSSLSRPGGRWTTTSAPSPCTSSRNWPGKRRASRPADVLCLLDRQLAEADLIFLNLGCMLEDEELLQILDKLKAAYPWARHALRLEHFEFWPPEALASRRPPTGRDGLRSLRGGRGLRWAG